MALAFLLLILAAAYELRLLSIQGPPSPLFLVPFIILAGATLMIPGNLTLPSVLKRQIQQTRTAAVVMAGLAPFVAWHIHQPQNFYLVINGGLALVAFFIFMVQIAMLVELFFVAAHRLTLAHVTLWTRRLISFGALSLTVAAYSFMLPRMLKPHSPSLTDYFHLWHLLPGAVQAIACMVYLAPLAAIAVLLWLIPETAVHLARYEKTL